MKSIDAQKLINDWLVEFDVDGRCEFGGFSSNLGPGVRGITYYYPSKKTRILLYAKLSGWRAKCTLWHEFCHHWAFVEYNYTGHQGTFDTLVRKKVWLWLGCALSRCIPI